MIFLLLPLITLIAYIFKLDTFLIIVTALTIAYAIYNLWLLWNFPLFRRRDHARIVLDIYQLPRIQENPQDFVVNQEGGANDVHDHQIQEGVKDSVKNLKKWFEHKTPNVSNSVNQIKEFLFSSDYNEVWTKKEKCYSTLRSMERINGTMSSIQMTELEVLDMVWQRICDPLNESKSQMLKDSLLDQLSDSSIKLDTPYCLVGRITRTLQSLQSLDNDDVVTMKSGDILSREIQGKIPKLVEQYFSENKEEKDKYDNGCDETADKLISYVEKLIIPEYPDSKETYEIIQEHLQELK